MGKLMTAIACSGLFVAPLLGGCAQTPSGGTPGSTKTSAADIATAVHATAEKDCGCGMCAGKGCAPCRGKNCYFCVAKGLVTNECGCGSCTAKGCTTCGPGCDVCKFNLAPVEAARKATPSP